MEEYTNSTVIDDGSDLFMDAPEETTEDVQEPVEHEEPTDNPADDTPTDDTPADDSEKPAEKQGIRITYLGEEKELSYEEAVTLAQKGMNYDKILQERDTYKATHDEADKSLKELGKWAKQAGMTLPEYVEHLQSVRHTQSLNTEIAAIRAKYPEIPEEAAKEMAETRIKEQDAEEQRAAQERQREAQAEQERAAQEPWNEFVRRYPDMDSVEKIPAEVMAEIEQGARPVEAMQRYEKKELQKQITELTTKVSQLEKNKENKEKALPNVSTSRNTEPVDPFLEGLFS